jgi:hypothetical protein
MNKWSSLFCSTFSYKVLFTTLTLSWKKLSWSLSLPTPVKHLSGAPL